MKNEVETAIKVAVTQMRADSKSEDALRFTQAALNLAHLYNLLKLNEVPDGSKP